MQVFTQVAEWQHFRKTQDPKLHVGFVPTMGNLHQGHLSLINKAITANDQTVVSLFVNPTQFNQADDFKNYPRTLEADLALLAQNKVDYILLPDAQEIYPCAQHFTLAEHDLSTIMEGEYRPGHFNGVLQIVLILFNLVKPTRAYFGEKDYQQYLLIRKMIDAFFMDIEVISCPTIRESSGLAYSSRNNLLNREERNQAENFARIFHKQSSTSQILSELNKIGIKVNYLKEYAGRRYIAVQIGAIRLIDNYSLEA